MARKKFFYNRVYNVRRNIINMVIIGLCVIGIIVCFIVTSNFKSKNNPKEVIATIKEEVTIEVNDTVSKEMYFSKLENANLDEIEVKYPDDFSSSKVGSYNVTITINGKNYDSTLNIVDTQKPNLEVKNVNIYKNEKYDVNSFVISCYDNSNNECIISFYEGATDVDGNKLNFANYKSSGVYNVKISAKDQNGNEIVKDAILTINKKNSTKPVTPVLEECKYGNSNYDASKYTLSVSITSNNCAVSLDLYKSEQTTSAINKLMETETIRIKKDIEKLNLDGKFALNRQISAIFNEEANGLVGYELSITVNITNNNESKNVVSYKVNSEGKRVFSNNPYNLPN